MTGGINVMFINKTIHTVLMKEVKNQNTNILS